MGAQEIYNEDELLEAGVESDAKLQMQLKEEEIVMVKDLLQFDGEFNDGILHRGICIEDEGRTLKKTSRSPDSNNVFLKGGITNMDAWVEMLVHTTTDELVIGVTSTPGNVVEISGSKNVQLQNVWCFSKRGGGMPAIIFDSVSSNGRPLPLGVDGCQLPEHASQMKSGDRISVYVCPEMRQVKFYLNGILMVDNLSHPDGVQLPEAQSYHIWVLVDGMLDHVEIMDAAVGCGPANVGS